MHVVGSDIDVLLDMWCGAWDGKSRAGWSEIEHVRANSFVVDLVCGHIEAIPLMLLASSAGFMGPAFE